ncbi:MobP3 family relaxase, partial [Ruthenibacterium lactatiformans]
MAKLVTKWRYLKPDAARHAQAYIRYIATREGVEKYVEENGARPAVQAQRVLVEKLLRDFPDARRSFEYEDYARRPTVRNASEFITRTLEEHLELFDARFNYVSYIAQRPRVQRSGAHGLFTQEEDAPDLNAAARAVSEHDGNIWTCILSLRREDAARLSYDKADAWRALLRANAAEIAARFNVPVGSFHWCGAFHNEAHHPHVHLVCYADRVQKPALTKEGVVQLRSLLARQIFRDELDAIYIRQSQSRDELRDLFSARLKEAVAGMRDAPAEMPVLESLLERLSEEVRDRKGKLQYGYLPWPVKSIVDSIISELEKQPQVKAAYSTWWELRKTVLSTYRDSLPEQAPPLHTQKEFRHLKNIVLRIAKEGCPAPELEQEFDAVQDPQDRGAQYAVYGAKRLLDAAREEEYPDEDVQTALRMLLAAAERGDAYAQYQAGKLYREGYFLPR